MTTPGTGPHALIVTAAGIEHRSRHSVGTLDGVAVLQVSGANPVGRGGLKLDAVGRVCWRAPGSATFGAGESAVGEHILHDGENDNAWLHVRVYPDRLPDAETDAAVDVLPAIAAGLAGDDITDAERTAGLVRTIELAIACRVDTPASDVVAWLSADAVAAGCEISPDDSTYTSPTTEGAGVSLGTISPGNPAALFLRVTVGAGAVPTIDASRVIHLAHTNP